jgi:hypothetical protein
MGLEVLGPKHDRLGPANPDLMIYCLRRSYGAGTCGELLDGVYACMVGPLSSGHHHPWLGSWPTAIFIPSQAAHIAAA